MTMTMTIFYLSINVQLTLYIIKLSHFYNLQNGLETIIKTKLKYFVAFIIATSKEFNGNQINVLSQSYGQHAGEI